MKWRLLTHPALRLTLAELESSWSLDDALEAHTVLDAIEDAQALAHAAAEAGGG